MPMWWLIKAEYADRSEVVETCEADSKLRYIEEFLSLPQCRVRVSQRDDFLQPWRLVETLETLEP